MTPDELSQVLRQIEDHLFPKFELTVHERLVYYHLLRHTHANGRPDNMFAMAPVAVAMGVSESTVRDSIRRLAAIGCIRIEDRSRRGHFVRVLLPAEIPDVIPAQRDSTGAVPIEELDFFEGRVYLRAILERESGKCFYCMRSIDDARCELDHVVSRARAGGNSYRNIVASCHECNTTKQESEADDFLRLLYRAGVMSQAELAARLAALEDLKEGRLVPVVAGEGAG
jgi:hypothetical protein